MSQGFADVVAWAMHEAIEHDLPDVVIPETVRGDRTYPSRIVRPEAMDCTFQVWAWVQMWSDTSLGLGAGGQAITDAVTTVVGDITRGMGAVYVGRHFRGLTDLQAEGCMKAIHEHRIIKRSRPEFGLTR